MIKYVVTALPANKSAMEPVLLTAVEERQLAEQALLAAIQSGTWTNVTVSQVQVSTSQNIFTGWASSF